jgi:hypothetical protein
VSSHDTTLALLSENEYDTLAQYLASWPNERSAGTWRGRFAVWWDRNPFFASGGARGWMLMNEGQIRGFFGVVPVGFQVMGQETTAFASTTWRVDPDLRHQSLGAIAQALRHTKNALLFVSTLTPALMKMLLALKFLTLTRGQHFYGWQPNTLPLRLDRLALMKPGAQLAPSALYRLYPRAVRTRLRLGARGLESCELAKADHAFDDLWTRTRHYVPTTNVRTAAYFNWHCFAGTYSAKKLYGCYRGDRLVGACVAWPRPTRRGMVIYECVDIWTDRDQPRAVMSLLSALVTGALRDGADAVELPHFSPALHWVAVSSGFLPRKLSDRGEVYLAPKNMLSSIGPHNSYFCSLQGDYGL